MLTALAFDDRFGLLVDDWGLAPVQDPERRDLLEILEDRDVTRSPIITSQLPPAQWHDYLTDATLADAICDRLLRNAHRPPSVAPLRSRCAELSLQHGAIRVFTMTEMRAEKRAARDETK